MYIYKGKAYILSNEYNQALLYEKLHIPSFYMHCDQFHLTIQGLGSFLKEKSITNINKFEIYLDEVNCKLILNRKMFLQHTKVLEVKKM